MAKTRTAEPITDTAALIATIEALKAENATLGTQIAEADAAANENRFFKLFPVKSVIFRTRIQPPGKTYNDGTIPQRFADVTIQVGDQEGCYIPNCNIVYKTFVTGLQRFELQMPSSSRAQGAMHVPFLEVPKGTQADSDYAEWQTAVVDRWMTERKALVASGAPTLATSIRNTGVTVSPGQSDELLAALGIVRNDPKLAAAPAAPVAPAV